MIQVKHRNRLPFPQPAIVHLRRSYAESRYGQIHLWTAYPSGGGFDEGTPVVCLHHSGGSGRLFAPMMRELGSDRSVYAPDLPGHGSSEAAGSKATVADLAGAVGDFIDELRLRTIDLFGHQLGALVATELAILRPQQVRRIMLWGVPCHSAQDRIALLQQVNIPGTREDGGDVIEAWQRRLDRRGANAPISSSVEEFADCLHAGRHGSSALAAVMEYPTAERLPLVKQQTLVLRLHDEYEDHAARARAALSNGSILDLPDYGQGFLTAAPQRFSSVAREFFDR
ncbi:alpha/beta fold family hydrolase [Steroidobacter denitrificans]|uniref:Alpha/beta fold family hydrolase n=1 Tax=Steroidobacter denitrificans TaxID=465721 RepID=A0A127F7Y3_STEDE|nr:alpha/beta hydrolase [Steroidobacter denitrificans]AMN45660.1 alpha/beta fold family hydrolase [Steroidobacter denitrificans]